MVDPQSRNVYVLSILCIFQGLLRRVIVKGSPGKKKISGFYQVDLHKKVNNFVYHKGTKEPLLITLT